MLNPLAEQLIYDLRHDKHTKEHFSIHAWEGKGTCGTVGCIAGTALARHLKLKPGDSIINSPKEGSYVEHGSQVLGIDERVGFQLFIPTDFWFRPLSQDTLFYDYSHNEKPSESYIQELKSWAEKLNHLETGFKPEICANALEQVTLHEKPYVDWMQAFELESV